MTTYYEVACYAFSCYVDNEGTEISEPVSIERPLIHGWEVYVTERDDELEYIDVIHSEEFKDETAAFDKAELLAKEYNTEVSYY